MCPFSILAFLQPTTVDKEPITFDAHPHSGWLFCLAPSGARRTESHITKKRTKKASNPIKEGFKAKRTENKIKR